MKETRKENKKENKKEKQKKRMKASNSYGSGRKVDDLHKTVDGARLVLKYSQLLEAVDIAGQTPAQISLDRVTREVLQAAAEDGDWERGMVASGDAEQEVEDGPEDYFAAFNTKEDRVGVPHQCERELFFVTPKASIKEVTTFRLEMLENTT
eukprot:Skav227770  [mRNA]  locus=scaffold1237:26689:31016:+ [translate_table: standard]